MNKWNKHFFEQCELLANWSECLSRKVGAVIVRDNVMVSSGFNGPPRGVVHCGEKRIIVDSSLPYIKPKDRHLCPRKALHFKSGEGLEFCTALHAEENAIINAARIGVSTNETTIFMNCGVPCKDCLKKIINAGITKIVCIDVHDTYDRLSMFLISQSNLIIEDYEGRYLK